MSREHSLHSSRHEGTTGRGGGCCGRGRGNGHGRNHGGGRGHGRGDFANSRFAPASTPLGWIVESNAALERNEHPRPAPPRSPIVAQVQQESCVNCGACAEACPEGAIEVADSTYVDVERCIGCGWCVGSCPNGSISMADRREVRKS